jgi:hypothetical protein
MIESHTGPRVVIDGSRQIEIYPLPTFHADDFQLVYLPRAKILIEADHASPRKNQIRPAPLVNELLQGIQRLKLDVGSSLEFMGTREYRGIASGRQSRPTVDDPAGL